MATFTESFDTADSTTLGPDLAWAESFGFGGDLQVVSNECVLVGGAGDSRGAFCAEGGLGFLADQTISLEVRDFEQLIFPTVENPLFLYARQGGGSYIILQLYHDLALSQPGGTWWLGTNSAPILASAVVGFPDVGDVVTLEAIGTTAKAYLNGVEKLSCTVPAGVDGTTVGFLLAGGGHAIDNVEIVGELVTPPGDDPPAAPVLSGMAGDGVNHLSWTTPDPGDGTITGYNIYRGTLPDTETLLDDVGLVNVYDDLAVANGVTYYYKVSAVNDV